MTKKVAGIEVVVELIDGYYQIVGASLVASVVKESFESWHLEEGVADAGKMFVEFEAPEEV